MRAFPILLACFVAANAFAAPELVLKRSIPLPDVSGRIDHLSYDPQTKRLFIAALGNGSLEVIDLDKGECVKSVKGLNEPQGLAYVDATKQIVVACGGDGAVIAFDSTTLEERVRIHVGDDADNVRLDPDGKTLVVGHSSGALTMLESATLKTTREIKLTDHPESFQLEPGSSRIFVNVPGGPIGGGGHIEVADRSAQKVTATWKLSDAGRNFPMALDASHKRLFIGCRRDAHLLVIDTDSGKTIASPPCVGDADDVFVDDQSGQIFVIGGDGAIDGFETSDQNTFTRISSTKTASGARTGLLVQDLHTLFVAVPQKSGHAAEIREYELPKTSSDRKKP